MRFLNLVSAFQTHFLHPPINLNFTGNSSRRGQSLDRGLRSQDFAGLRSRGGCPSLRQVVKDRGDRQRRSDHAGIRNEESRKRTSDLKSLLLTQQTKVLI